MGGEQALLVAAAQPPPRSPPDRRPPPLQITFNGAGCTAVLPDEPANLRAVAGDGSVTLSWDRPRNGGCVAEYAVSVTPLGRSSRSFGAAPQRTPQFTLRIDQLTNGEAYRFSVVVSGRGGCGGEGAAVHGGSTGAGSARPSAHRWCPPSTPTHLAGHLPQPGPRRRGVGGGDAPGAAPAHLPVLAPAAAQRAHRPRRHAPLPRRSAVLGPARQLWLHR